MSTNLEIKVKVNGFENYLKLLENIKAKYIGELNQKDIYYKTKSGLLKLRIEGNKKELIKYNRAEDKKNRWSDYEIITFESKNPKKIMDSLFDYETTIIKTRKLFIYKNTRIHLDTVKGLGKFIELETIVTSTKKDAQERFNYLVNKLNLNKKNELRLSYRNLMLKKN
ncbi:MAG: class IV adenylate cyclase [Ignavibacterium sp.]